jgi:polysaccharide biosynthesis protein VpsJ
MTHAQTATAEPVVEFAAKGERTSALYDSVTRLVNWLELNDYRGYDTFDGLSSTYLRPLTFGNKYLRIALQQGVRRFPLNLRPLLGIEKQHSSKAMGFFARGFIRLSRATGDRTWDDKARHCLTWLTAHRLPGYSGACWGNHFDYQSRGGRIPHGVPTVVWSSLIGHAFLDAYDHFRDDDYLAIADSICEHIVRDLRTHADGASLCISYIPGADSWVHNANTLGASFLARTSAITDNSAYRTLATGAMQYTAKYQRPNGSWYYAEPTKFHWIDNFHTGYVLDCFKYYADATGDSQFDSTMERGYQFWRDTFFLPDGTPRYYDVKTLPLDIQCASQAIDTLLMYSSHDAGALELAQRVASWTIRNMQDKTGYFYYRRYGGWLVNKTPTLHWGQATMLCALSGLYAALPRSARAS